MRRSHQLTGDGVVVGEEQEEEVSEEVDVNKTMSVIKELQPVLQRYLFSNEDFDLEEEIPKTWRHDRKLNSYMVDENWLSLHSFHWKELREAKDSGVFQKERLGSRALIV